MGKIVAILYVLSFALIPVMYVMDITRAVFRGMWLGIRNAHTMSVFDIRRAARVTINDVKSAWKGK